VTNNTADFCSFYFHGLQFLFSTANFHLIELEHFNLTKEL